ncbi:MAG: DNA recombination protein RmuC [Clostridia bacterium]|nr:DNA recombination protein RmuC [Clostridia bacterium]
MTLEIAIIALLALVLVTNFIIIFRKGKGGGSDTEAQFKKQNELNERLSKMQMDNIKAYNETVLNTIAQQNYLQKQEFSHIQTRLENILRTNDERLNRATDVLSQGLTKLQRDNERKLDEMRQTVDEKLNVSLERRLTESFNVINQRLQSVYEGLGEMKSLASGVGDLKRVLTNVKTRGTWGEVQLSNILEQMLSKEQFSEQVDIKGNGERVDFAVVLPGKDEQNVYLPIDAKFPIEDYQRVVDASERGDKEDVEAALKQLERRVKEDAKSIKEKYIALPKTTDFAIMYLAIEGLYAEVLRRTGLTETLQREYKVIVCGPTTITALLNSLQLGFKTLSIEKRSSEIYQLLGVFKQEFGKFVELLAKTQKKLAEASNTIEFATKKSRTIERKLKSVSSVTDADEGATLIDFEDVASDE